MCKASLHSKPDLYVSRVDTDAFASSVAAHRTALAT
jgi:hypothetical protein